MTISKTKRIALLKEALQKLNRASFILDRARGRHEIALAKSKRKN